MPLLYGEGAKASIRLQEKIMKISDDQCPNDNDAELFQSRGNLLRGPLARSPAEFSNARDIVPYRHQQASQPYVTTNYGLRMHVPLHRLRNTGGNTPVYLAELTCHYEGDFSGSLGVYIRPIKSDQYGRDHTKRSPVVVDVEKHDPPIWTTIFLLRDMLLPGSEDFDRHHGILARLHSLEHGFEVAHASPQDKWKRIKGRAAIILDPGQYSAVAFKRSDGIRFAILMSYAPSSQVPESDDYDTWELGVGRCRIFVYESPAGAFTEQGLRNLDYALKYEGPRAERFAPCLDGCRDKTHHKLPTKKIVVAESKRETIMGERMLVLDINIYEENTGLHLLSGDSMAPKPGHGNLQEEMPQLEVKRRRGNMRSMIHQLGSRRRSFSKLQ